VLDINAALQLDGARQYFEENLLAMKREHLFILDGRFLDPKRHAAS